MKGKIKKIEKSLLKYYYVIQFILSIFMSFSIYKIYFYKHYYNHISYKNIIFVLILIIILIYYLIKMLKEKKTEKIFLSIAIPIGMCFIMLLTPGFVADETAHGYRAYDISIGNLITPKDKNGISHTFIPVQLDFRDREEFNTYKEFEEKIKQEANYEETVEVANPAKSYSPVLYIFSSISFALARILGWNPLLAIYLGRILNYIFFLIIAYMGIKKIPFGKFVLFVYLLNPMVIHQAASISADSLINSICIGYIVYLLYLWKNKETINKKQKIIVSILSVIVASIKYVYFPLVFLTLLLLDKKKKISNKNSYIFVLIILSIAIALGMYFLGTGYNNFDSWSQMYKVDATGQIKQIITNPLYYIQVLAHSIEEYAQIFIYQFAGSSLGWLDIKVNSGITLLYIIMMIVTPFLEKNKIELKRKQKLLLILVAIMIGLIIFTGMYITYSTLGGNIILGVQGRYFIPCLILILLTMINIDKKIIYKYTIPIYIILIVLIQMASLNEIIRFFL